MASSRDHIEVHMPGQLHLRLETKAKPNRKLLKRLAELISSWQYDDDWLYDLAGVGGGE